MNVVQLVILLANMNFQNGPSMKSWTNAWHLSDSVALTDLYATNASVFPPKRPTIVGNLEIINYFKGGLGKVDVHFDPFFLEVAGNLAFELGEFRDVLWGTDELTEKGKYSITWIKSEGKWKILCHVFSIGTE